VRLARLRQWREAKGLTQKELAREARASEWTVVRAEAGAEIRPNTARRLAEVMGVDVADLIERPPVPLAEAPRGSGQAKPEEPLYVPDDIEELLTRCGVRTRHLADKNLSDKLEERSPEEVLRIAREVRQEKDALADYYARLIEEARENPKAGRFAHEVATASLGATFAFAKRLNLEYKKVEPETTSPEVEEDPHVLREAYVLVGAGGM
jgi:transcriptional regulator with XRE-family HTH domain